MRNIGAIECRGPNQVFSALGLNPALTGWTESVSVVTVTVLSLHSERLRLREHSSDRYSGSILHVVMVDDRECGQALPAPEAKQRSAARVGRKGLCERNIYQRWCGQISESQLDLSSLQISSLGFAIISLTEGECAHFPSAEPPIQLA